MSRQRRLQKVHADLNGPTLVAVDVANLGLRSYAEVLSQGNCFVFAYTG